MRAAIPSPGKVLLQKVAGGDQLAFKSLFNLYRPNIYTTALRITGNEWTAEEILQDTFLKVWLKREELPGLENFGGWIYTIARNFTFNTIKRMQQERSQLTQLTQDALPGTYTPTDQLVRDKEFQLILARAIERLPEKQRLTYILIKQQDKKRNEVAQELNVSPETVKWNLEQAMKNIRAYCLAHLDDAPLVLLLYFFTKYF